MFAPPFKTQSDRSDAVTYAAAFLFFAACFYVDYRGGFAGDKDFRLMDVHLWLHGRVLYDTTYFDVNLPLSMWLYSVPVSIAEALGVADFHALVIFGACFIAFALRLIWRLLVHHPQLQEVHKRRMFCLLLVFYYVVVPGGSWFFEREHIFLVCIMPYLLRFLPSLGAAPLPLGWRLQAGALAALGFCVKPHCVIPFAGIQLVSLWLMRSPRILFSAENFIIYAGAAVYAACVWVFAPGWYDIVLPMAMATYRSTTDYMDGRMIYAALALFTASLTLVDFRWRADSPWRKDIYYLLGLSPFFALYIFANNGWTTTYYPLIGVLLMLTAMVRWEALWLEKDAGERGLPVTRLRFCARACAVALALNVAASLPAVWRFYTFTCADHVECRVDRDLMKEVRAADGRPTAFGTMSSVYGRWIELNRHTGAPLVTRFHHLWMLPKFELAGPGFYPGHEWILDYLAKAYAADIRAGKPEVVFVDEFDTLSRDGKQVSLPDYFSRDPDFNAVWADYRLDHVIDYCTSYLHDRPGCKFDAYKRKGS